MKNAIWISLGIGIFFLIIIGMCSNPSDKSSSLAIDSIAETDTEKVSELEKAKEDSLNAVKISELKNFFTEDKDEFSDKTWVEPKTRPRYINQNGYYMYFVMEGGKAVVPIFKIQYEADDWLFIKNMIFNVDGENIEFTPTKMERDCGDGRIWEWCDEIAFDLEPLIKKIAYANTVKIKMVGSHYSNVKTMSSKQIQYFKYSYEYYKALGGKFKNE